MPPDPQTKSKGTGARLREIGEEYSIAIAIGVYAALVLVGLVAAYFAIFTIFAEYDDEGTMLMSLRGFVAGEALYRDVWSVYGPFYYELFGGFFSLTGWSISTDAGRSLVIVIWVATSLMLGLATQRLTGRLALGVAAMAVAFGALAVLVREPMHPHGAAVLLFAAFALLAAGGLGGRDTWTGAGCGALLAALTLTKINLGVYAVAAVALAAVLTVAPLSRRGWLRWLVIVAFLAVPVVILQRDLNLAWVRELVLLELLAGTALLCAAWPVVGAGAGDGNRLLRWLLAAIAGFAAAAVLSIGIVLLTGPSLADVYHGIVTEALHTRDILLGQLPFPPSVAVEWGVAAVAAAALVTWLRRIGDGRASLVAALARIAVGLVIWLNVSGLVPISINSPAASPILAPLLLAWVAAIAPAGAVESPYKRFLRVLLPAIAIVETLQVYPVPQSQVGIASVFFIPVGALCLADGLTEARAAVAARGGLALGRYAAVATVTSVALAAMVVLNTIVQPGVSNAIAYRDTPELDLPGAQSLHLAEPRNAEYTEVVRLLHKSGCTTFVGYPSIGSLYIWSQLEPPSYYLVNGWFHSLDDERQQEVVDGMRAAERPCVVRNQTLAENMYLHGEPPPDRPLVRYIEAEFRPAWEVGGFQLLTPKPGATDGGSPTSVG
ncbi:MAG TPA: hypothetical protein VMS11_12765 [Solirubrobacterales bacterium]|nr:hypothetical protein [Solirubrobacterales bacterium]